MIVENAPWMLNAALVIVAPFQIAPRICSRQVESGEVSFRISLHERCCSVVASSRVILRFHLYRDEVELLSLAGFGRWRCEMSGEWDS